MSHDPIQLHVCTSDIPKGCYWKNNEGKVMVTLTVCERQEPSEKGSTHYATVYEKDGAGKIYVGNGKFKPFERAVVNDEDLPPTNINGIEDANIESNPPF